jgi:hypothetical protein
MTIPPANAYTPDNWVVIKLSGRDPHYRVLAGWSGGYTHGTSWRMNSGITRVEEDENHFYFYGASGSCYACNKESYYLKSNIAYVWNELHNKHGDQVEIMPEDTDWINLDWII